jgi:dihydrolipoamide dehydrogenase
VEKKHYEIVVIGGGPGGYVAAIRAASRGAKTALIEARELGGVCLNRGCIPSKALIADAEMYAKMKRCEEYGIKADSLSFDYQKMNERKNRIVRDLRASVEKLVTANQIDIYRGIGRFTGEHEIKIGNEESLISFDKAIIATGSEPRALSQFPFDYKQIHDSTSLLEITALPKTIVIIGGGTIGCEFASCHHALGVEVTIIELLPSIIAIEGKTISDALASSFTRRGIKIETNTTVTQIEKNETGLRISTSNQKVFEADICLISVGRKMNTDDIGLEKVGIVVNEGGVIGTNEKMQTNVAHIYAIGDITGKLLLAHLASHQGIVAADHATGYDTTMHYHAVPSVTFTSPQIGTVGYTLDKAIQLGYSAKVGKYPFQALGKARAIHETEGFAQIVIDKNTGQILGAQVFGYEAATLIAEMTLAIQNELTLDCIVETIHAHPTLSEVWLEAAFLAADTPLHYPPIKKHG